MRLVKINEDSSWMWEWEDIRVLVDPWFTPSQINCIFISHHFNKENLLQFDKDIPVISRSGT